MDVKFTCTTLYCTSVVPSCAGPLLVLADKPSNNRIVRIDDIKVLRKNLGRERISLQSPAPEVKYEAIIENRGMAV